MDTCVYNINELRICPSGFEILASSLIEHHSLRNFNRLYSHAYGGSRKKLLKQQPRPHKPTRNQLREAIPFLDHIKQCQDPDEALSMFHRYYEMGYCLDYPFYASIIYKLARAKEFESVDTVLNFLRTRDVRCQEALFIALMRHYEKARLIDKAVVLFREMGRSFNCVRTVQSFNTMLNVFVVNDRVCEAVGFFKDGLKMGFKLNPVSFNIMIKMWLGKGEWEKARQVFDEMLERELEPTVVTYNSQIGFLCKRGDVDEAKVLFEDMVRRGERGNAVTYALLMEGLCDLGKFKEAKKMMFDMEYQGCKVELVNYGVLMSDLAKRGLMNEAKGLLVEMKKRRVKPDVIMYNILINNLCKEGAASEAYKLLVDMQVKGCEPNAATYRMVVDGFCRTGDFAGGLKVLNAMLCSKHTPRLETFCSLVIGLIHRGEVNDACFVLEEMERRKMRLNSESWEILVSESCYNHEVVTGILADIVCSFRGACGITSDLLTMKLMPTASMFNAIMAGYFHEHYNDMLDAEIQPIKQVFMALVNAYAACGEFDKAKKAIFDKRIPVKNSNEIKGALVGALAIFFELMFL